MNRFVLVAMLCSLALTGCAAEEETTDRPGPPPEQPTPPSDEPDPDAPSDPGEEPAPVPSGQSMVSGTLLGQEVLLDTALLLDLQDPEVTTQVIALASGVTCDLNSFTGVTLVVGPCDPLAPDITPGSHALVGDCEQGAPGWTALVEVDAADQAYAVAGTASVAVDESGAMTGTVDVELDSGDTFSGTFAIADTCLIELD